VRSAEETPAALDQRGQLPNLRSMPEMPVFRGRRPTVRKVVHRGLRYGQCFGYATDEQRYAPDELPVRRLGACWMPDCVLLLLKRAMAGTQLAPVARCMQVLTPSWQSATRAGTASALDRCLSCPGPTSIRHVRKPIAKARAGGAACCHDEGADASRYTCLDTTWRGHRDDDCE
jgi:hypothetical protein